MNQLSSKDRLKDKFSKLEMDVDDERFVHKLTEASISNIKPVSQTSSRGNGFTSLFKLMKYGSFVTFKKTKHACSYSFNKITSFSANVFSKTVQFAREKEEYTELLLERKVNQVELIKKEQKENEELKKQNLKNLIGDFHRNMDLLFQDKIDSDDFSIQYASEDNLKSVLEGQTLLMDIVSKKIIYNRMIMNIKNVKFKIAFAGDELASKMTFELDKKGHLWATMFGKSIVPDLYKVLESKQGKITIKQSYNTTTGKDLFFMTMSYKLKEQLKASIFTTSVRDEIRDQTL
ncbi:hypothetical protein SHI21_15810 [Bacteriovorax sp. PP10]|uniref:Uncharacterized protein n=1 Tax=Bacteriovorax antarcticus TaxID=3088717 RepID=A0ABU5VXC1_9BACT|nr:hypothetical protein [Bacteriovorax sp. PP10]MEA9357696.1 hypothetical protein [Bacteriovorax sp. PP10]